MGRRQGGPGKKPVIEAGRIVARLCRVYGWTPDYCLDRLSWPQVLMYDAYAEEREIVRRPVSTPAPAAFLRDEDAPDAAAIEMIGVRRTVNGR